MAEDAFLLVRTVGLSSAHGGGFHHIRLGKHHRSADRFINHIVPWNALRLIVHIGNFLLYYLAEWLRTALCAGILAARSSHRSTFEHDVLNLVTDFLYRYNACARLNLGYHFRPDTGHHLSDHGPLRAVLRGPATRHGFCGSCGADND